MNNFIALSALSPSQLVHYNDAISKAFPQIISESPVIKRNWSKLERYFPQHQQFLISAEDQLIGFINTVPFHFDKALSKLPDTGWDWMFEKGITDYENSVKPNYLGGLQVIVRQEFQKQGYSKRILNHAKTIFKTLGYDNLLIPIRPTKKHEFPAMAMTSYLNLKEKGEIFDPWIRTHVKGGAEVIKVCKQSMTMKGDVEFWEAMLQRKILQSGKHKLEGALELISIDFENDTGVYREPNVWIKYD